MATLRRTRRAQEALATNTGRRRSPVAALAVTLILIAAAEAAVMLVLSVLRPFPAIATALIDAGSLTALVLPALYLLSFRPLMLRTEEALWQSEERYRTIVDNVDEVIYEVASPDDPLAGRVGFVSESVQKITGYRPDEFVRNPGLWLETLHPDDRAGVRETTLQMVASKLPATREYRLRHRETAEYRWMEDRVLPQFNERGDVIAMRGVARDITARKQAEETMRESQELLARTFASLQEAVFVVEPVSRTIIASNPASERILGYAPEEMVGRSTEFLHVNRALYEEFGRQLFPALDADGIFHVEYQLRRKDGSIVETDHTVAQIVDDLGRRTSLVSVVRDITQRKQAEEALRESGQKYRELVESLNDVIYELDAGGRVTYISPAVETGGYQPSDIIGRLFIEFLHPDDVWRLAGSFRRGLSGIHEPNEYRIWSKSGEILWVRSNGRAILEGERVAGFRGVLTDVTDLKRAEEALQSAREELEGRVERQILRRNPYGLTFREFTVLHLVAAGRSDKEIGTELVISPRTAQKHISNILTKMQASGRTEAGVRAVREGLLE